MPCGFSRVFAVAAVVSLLLGAALAVAPARAGSGAGAGAGAGADIQVAPGAPGALITGAVLRGERDAYRLAAKAGQTLSVEIVSVEENAVFQIYLPGKGRGTLPGAGTLDDAVTWRGQLPKDGTYTIVVGGTRGNAEYTLRVDVEESTK